MIHDWIDVSVPLHSGMVHWPDAVHGIAYRYPHGWPISLPARGQGLHEMPFHAALGRARVIEIGDPESIKPGELRPHHIRQGERLLFKTLNSSRCWKTDTFAEDFVYLSQEAARYLASVGVLTVGIDYLSVGGYTKDGVETHRALLEADIWIIEGLDLSQVEPGTYELICLPLRIDGSDGAPARAILRKADEDDGA